MSIDQWTNDQWMNVKKEKSDSEKMEVVVYDKWYEVIPKNSIVRSTPGLLIRTSKNNICSGTCFMYLTQSSGQIQISDFRPRFLKYYPSSCNGFLLDVSSVFKTSHFDYELMIINPATNQRLQLPRLIDPTQPPYYKSAIAYVATRMEYKVVHAYWPVDPFSVFGPPPVLRINCAILTVGVDNVWRLVDTQHLSLNACQQFLMNPLVTEGFVHWAHDWRINGCLRFSSILTTHMSCNFVLTLNMETETITKFKVPRCVGGYYYYKYFSTGESNLSLLIGRGYLKWNVWEMISETGEWTMLPDIDLEAHKALLNGSYDRQEGPFKPVEGDCLDCKLVPAGWLKYRVVIIFVVCRPMKNKAFSLSHLCVVYNVQTDDITLLMLDSTRHPYLFHRNNQLSI